MVEVQKWLKTIPSKWSLFISVVMQFDAFIFPFTKKTKPLNTSQDQFQSSPDVRYGVLKSFPPPMERSQFLNKGTVSKQKR